jgi:hypothetical protein
MLAAVFRLNAENHAVISKSSFTQRFYLSSQIVQNNKRTFWGVLLLYTFFINSFIPPLSGLGETAQNEWARRKLPALLLPAAPH